MYDPDVPSTSRDQEQFNAVEIPEEQENDEENTPLIRPPTPILIIPSEEEEIQEERRERIFQVLLLLIYAGECMRMMLNIYLFLSLLNADREDYPTSTEGLDLGFCIVGILTLAYSLTDNPHRWVAIIIFAALSQVTPLTRNGLHWHTFLRVIAEFSDKVEKAKKFVYVLMYAVVILLYVYYVVGLVVTLSYLGFLLWKWRNRCISIRRAMNVIE